MGEQISFNINADLYQDDFGDLAIEFPGNKVYRQVGTKAGDLFVTDAVALLARGIVPGEWLEMPAHELVSGKNWRRLGRLGFINGEVERPAVELEVGKTQVGGLAKEYLKNVLKPEPD